MEKLDSAILNLMKVLYDINEEEEQKLIDSFSKTNEEDKKEVLIILGKAYKKFENNAKNLLNKITKINNEVVEFKEHLSADEILNQID